MISAQLSVTEAQLIPGGLASKNAMGGMASTPHLIWGWGSAQLKIVAAHLSAIEANQPDLTLKFGKGRGWGNIPSNNILYVVTVPSNNHFVLKILKFFEFNNLDFFQTQLK